MFARELEPTRVGERVVRLGTTLVNWFLVDDGTAVTIVDAGMPAYRPQLERGLELLGRRTSDVAAILLTHGHPDHIGVAERVRTELDVPVYVHRDEKELTTSGTAFGRRESSMLPYLRHVQAWKLNAHFKTAGKRVPVRQVTTFEDGADLDVPGRPRAVQTGGHTTGHTVFHFESHGAVFLGDLLCELNPLTGRRGPQLLPRALNMSSGAMLDSLTRIEHLDAPTVLFGHGDTWTRGIADAVRLARAAGFS